MVGVSTTSEVSNLICENVKVDLFEARVVTPGPSDQLRL